MQNQVGADGYDGDCNDSNSNCHGKGDCDDDSDSNNIEYTQSYMLAMSTSMSNLQ